jgi:uncharacterized protein YbcI
MESLVRSILGVPVKSFHTDISTKTGERVIVLTLESKLGLELAEDRQTRTGAPRDMK